MRLFRLCVAGLFGVMLILFSIVFINKLINTDKTVPTIKIEEKEIWIPVSATESEMLAGVTAYDEKDGDLTDNVIIQNLSNFTGSSTCTVTYMVWDSDNNYTSAKRTIHYTDYVPPHLTYNGPLMFQKSVAVNFRSVIGATDIIDGDIGRNVIINSSNIDESSEGDYEVIVTAFNSKGDRVTYNLPVTVYSTSTWNCEIRLSDYLVYAKVGSDLDFDSFVTGVYNRKEEALSCPVIAKTYDVNFGKPGVYRVRYETDPDTEYVSFTYLTVIVEE